jgi:hypothetical protein
MSNNGRKNENFTADVWLTCKRTLTNQTDWAIFRFHHLLGADWKLCARQLGIDKGQFFHAVYRVEQACGKVFRELKPYALWPLDEYFNATTRQVDIRPLAIPPKRHPNGVPLCAPLGVPLPQAPPEPAPEPEPREPEPVPTEPEPEPVPVAPFDIFDETEIAAFARRNFRAGRGLRATAAQLTKWKVPAPNGGAFRQSDVKHLLLCHSSEPAPVKLAA